MTHHYSFGPCPCRGAGRCVWCEREKLRLKVRDLRDRIDILEALLYSAIDRMGFIATIVSDEQECELMRLERCEAVARGAESVLLEGMDATPASRQIIALCRLHADHAAKTAADHGAARLAKKILKILEGET